MKKRYKADIIWKTNPNEILFEHLSFENLVEMDCQKFPTIHHPELSNKAYYWSRISNRKLRKS